jgi:hypothetical protein
MSGASTTITSGGLSFRTANNILGETTGGVYSLFNNLIAGGTLAIGGAGATTVNGSLTVVGLLTADGGLTLNTGDLLTATGGIKTNSIDVVAAANSLYIGDSQTTSGVITIGQNKTAGYIALGKIDAGTSVISNPILYCNSGISLSNASGISLTTTSYTPSSSQLGYYTSGQFVSTSCTTGGINLASISGILIGKYMLVVSHGCDTWSSTTSTTLQLSITTTNGTSDIFMIAFGASAATGGYTSGSYTGYVSITASTGTLQLKGTTSSGTVNCFSNIKIFRIA